MKPAQNRKKANSERGAAVIEMALVFGLFFGLCWGIISYSLPFFLYQVMSHATTEAARAAVRADPWQDEAAYVAKLKSLAQAHIDKTYDWLPATFSNALTSSIEVSELPAGSGRQVLVVKLTYSDYNTHPLVPNLTLPLLGTIPNIPGDLMAESRYRL